jgi:hypothetical protein
MAVLSGCHFIFLRSNVFLIFCILITWCAFTFCCCLALPLCWFAVYDFNTKLSTQIQSSKIYLIYDSYIYTRLFYFFFFYIYLLFLVGTNSTQSSIIFSLAFVQNSNLGQCHIFKVRITDAVTPIPSQGNPFLTLFSRVTWRYYQS